ncbi:MAG: TonB-dependent receptor [Bacteroidia bacterium]|nr:TonB-dependent receptor [Bacteroidia bacterium]
MYATLFSIWSQTLLRRAYLLSLLVSPLLLTAQSVLLTGKVTDDLGQPLAGVSVSVVSLRVGTYTDQAGAYQLTLDMGRAAQVELIASYTGYPVFRTLVVADGPAERPLDIQLTAMGFQQDEVVISQSRGIQQSQADLTGSIDVIKSQSIDLQAVASADKVINQVPGVDNQDGQISIRGSSGYAYGVGSRVMLTLDGLPLLSASSSSASLDLIPVDNISQIEVLKGASSVLYGSSALGGVISVIMADPQEKPRTSIRLRAGQYGRPYNPALDWDGDANAQLGSIHIFHSRKIGPVDFTLQSNTLRETGYRQGASSTELRNLVILKYRPKPLPGLTLGLNASLSVDSSGSILYWRGYFPDTVLVQGVPVVSGGALTPTLAAGGFRRQLNTELAIDPSVKYLTKSGHLFWYRGRYLRSDNRNNTNQESQNFIFYNDFLYQTTLFKKVNWVSGISATFSGIQGDSLFGGSYVFNGDTIQSTGGHTGNSVGVYTQLDGKFGRLNTSLGLRYETVQFDGASREDQPILRAGLNYKLAEGLNVRASFGQAFRVPSVAERFANTSGGGVVVEPNPNIRSERGYSLEVAIRQGYARVSPGLKVKAYLDLAGFMMRFEDMVEFGISKRQLFPLDIRFASTNISNARLTGVELTGYVLADWGKWFASFNGGVTWLDPINLNAVPDSLQLDLVTYPSDILNASKQDIPRILKYRSTWTVRATPTIGYGPVTLAGNFRYKSFIETIDQYLYLVVSDLAYFRSKYPKGDPVLDMTASVDFLKRHRVSLTVDNVFNREYLIVPGFLGPQRTFILQYQIKF